MVYRLGWLADREGWLAMFCRPGDLIASSLTLDAWKGATDIEFPLHTILSALHFSWHIIECPLTLHTVAKLVAQL